MERSHISLDEGMEKKKCNVHRRKHDVGFHVGNKVFLKLGKY